MRTCIFYICTNKFRKLDHVFKWSFHVPQTQHTFLMYSSLRSIASLSSVHIPQLSHTTLKKKLRQMRTAMKHIRENNLDRCRQMNRLLGIELIFFQPFNLMPRVKMPFQHIQFESCLWLRQFCLRLIQGRDLANVSFWLRGVGDFLVERPRKVGRLCEGFNFGSALGARQLSNQIKMSFAVILQQ